MEISPYHPRILKIPSILIRHSCSEQFRIDPNYQHPETSHLLKYFPKYYQNLSLKIARQNHFLAKIKRIKKLKGLTANFKDDIPEELWFNLFKHNRKEIEEIPEIEWYRHLKPGPLLKARIALKNVKFFLNLKKIFLPARRVYDCNDFNDFSNLRNSYAKYLRNMRKLRFLDLFVPSVEHKEMKWMLEKLNGMPWLLNRLETLSIQHTNLLKELYNYKNIASQLTNLDITGHTRFEGNLLIPEISKKLRFLSFSLSGSLGGKREFLKFLAGIQSLPDLVSLELSYVKDINYFWSCFRPQPSLRYLKVKFHTSGLVPRGYFDMKNLVGHWRDIVEMKSLEFDILCEREKDIVFVKWFITMVLKKIQKLASLKIRIKSDQKEENPEPFFVEKISHLYENLEKFEYVLGVNFAELDLWIMRPFKNLRVLKYQGKLLYFDSVKEAVEILERNKRKNAELELKITAENSACWLGETLKKVSRAKSSLKITMTLSYEAEYLCRNEVENIRRFCGAMRSVGKIKGLVIYLSFLDFSDDFFVENEELVAVMERYREIKNLVVVMRSHEVVLEYRKLEGEPEQLVRSRIYPY